MLMITRSHIRSILSVVGIVFTMILIASNAYSFSGVLNGVTKTVTPSIAKPGDTVTYTITYNADLSPPPSDVNITSSAGCPGTNPDATVTISGSSTVVVCDGARTWRRLTITNGATLTQSPIPPGGTSNQLVLTIRDTLTISNQGKIDVSGKGYPGSSNPHSYMGPCSPTSCNAPGNGEGPGGGLGVGDAPDCEERFGGGGGGSHGGTGAAAWQSPGAGYALPQLFGNSGIAPTYDDPNFPQIAGSGGGNWISHTDQFFGCNNNQNSGGAGGGVIRVRAATLVMNTAGFISAQGANADASGGGAGGAIWIEVENPIDVSSNGVSSSYTVTTTGGNGYYYGSPLLFSGQNGTITGLNEVLHPNASSTGDLNVYANGGNSNGIYSKGGTGGGGGRIALHKVPVGTISYTTSSSLPTYTLRDQLPTGVTYLSASPAPTSCGSAFPSGQYQCWRNNVLDPNGDGKINGSITMQAQLSQTIACGESTNYATLLMTQGGITTQLPAGSATVTVSCPPVIQTFTGSPSTITGTASVLGLSYTINNLQKGDSARVQENCTGFSRTNTYTLALVVPSTNGTYAVSFPTTAVLNGTCGYTLEVVRNGVVVASKAISIIIDIVPIPTITASLAPTAVAPGGTFTLNWTYSNANTVTTSVTGAGCPNPGTLNPPPPLSAGIITNGSKQLVAPTADPSTCVYTLTAVGPSGTTVSQPVTLTVSSSGGGGVSLSGITPNSGAQGCAVNVTLNGTNFSAPATIAVDGIGVTVSNATVVSVTQMTATFTISSIAGLGGHNVMVTIGSATSNPVTFTVTTGSCGSGGGTGGGGGGGGGGTGGGGFPTSCTYFICFTYDSRITTAPPPGFIKPQQNTSSEVAP